MERASKESLKPLKCPFCAKRGYKRVLLFYDEQSRFTIKCPSCKNVIKINIKD